MALRTSISTPRRLSTNYGRIQMPEAIPTELRRSGIPCQLSLIAYLFPGDVAVRPQIDPPLALEVASIRPGASTDSRSNDVCNDGGIVLTNVTLRQCVEAAYGIQDLNWSAPTGPKQRGSTSRPNPAVHPKEYLQPMLKTLLEERFKLAAHRETRMVLGYSLVVGKDGLKIKEVEPGEGKTNTSGSRFIGTKVTMNRLAQFLSRMLDRPVIDKTGAQAVFDIDLHYSWEGPSAVPRNKCRMHRRSSRRCRSSWA